MTVEALRALCAAALNHAMRNHLDDAGRVVVTIVKEHGSSGLGYATFYWIDALLDHNGRRNRSEPVTIRYFNEDLQRMDAPTSPEIGWAGRLIAARAAGDVPAAMAVVDELRQVRADSDALIAHTMAVLGICGLTIASTPPAT